MKYIDKLFFRRGKELDKFCENLLEEKGFGFEERLQSFYQSILKKGDMVIDIGAHSGRHTIPLAKCVGSRGEVVAFEVQKAPITKLVSQAKAFNIKNIKLQEVALSNYKGESIFYIADDRPEESGLLERSIFNGPTEISEISVSVNTLDSFEFIKPRFIKIDTEGAEFHVLEGAKSTILKYKPIIAFEFGASSYESYNVNPTDTYKFFENKNYMVLSIFGDALNCDSFVEASKEQTYWDYVACHQSDFAIVESVLKSYQKREIQ